MKKGLSRMRARISLGLLVLCVAAILIGTVREGWTLTLVGAVLFVLSMVIRPWKCPNCGNRMGVTLQWSEAGKHYCRYCGNRLAYDDEENKD